MATEVQIQPLAQSAPQRVVAFLSETASLYTRSMTKLLRRPVELCFSLFQPMIWLLLFGQVFSRIVDFPNAATAFAGKSYFQFFMPAVIVQIILFGASQSGMGILVDQNSGFLDKLRTTPISRTTILLGRVLSDLTRMMLQGVVIIAFTWVFGQFQDHKVDYEYGVLGIFAALGIAFLFGIGLSGLHVFIALRTRSVETSFLIANFLTLPLLFTSSAQLPIQLLPGWLQVVAQVNPLTYTINAMRIFLNGRQASLYGDPTIVIVDAVIILSAIAVITLTLAVRSFYRSVK